jgi:hypothetical protein
MKKESKNDTIGWKKLSKWPDFFFFVHPFLGSCIETQFSKSGGR